MRGSQTDRLVPARSRMSSVAALVIGALCLGTSSGAVAFETDEELNAQKEFWQERYSTLLNTADELRETIERERALYAAANRRNYRRGNKRHRHRETMLEAAAKLEVVESELDALPDEARRAGALPGWFYEIEEERK